MQPSASLQRRPPKPVKPFGFAAHQRLLTGKDFKQVFDHAKRYSSAEWTIYAWRHQTGVAQLGLAIAKKTVRRAHERNRLKRLARETFRLMQTELAGCSYVVMAGRAAEAADNAQLRHQLSRLFKMALNKPPRSTQQPRKEP